jgi:MFS superfamily sulfate permease-like transporter
MALDHRLASFLSSVARGLGLLLALFGAAPASAFLPPVTFSAAATYASVDFFEGSERRDDA